MEKFPSCNNYQISAKLTENSTKVQILHKLNIEMFFLPYNFLIFNLISKLGFEVLQNSPYFDDDGPYSFKGCITNINRRVIT